MAKKQVLSRRYSYNPIAGDNPTTLILGVAPSEKFIEQGQYYANPNDCFWEAIFPMIKAPASFPTSAYNTRLLFLNSNGIALWDVVQECERIGATNKDICEIKKYNDIPYFLEKYKSIENIIFNGKDAYTYFKRYMQARFPNCTNLKRLLKKKLVVVMCTAARTMENKDKILLDWQKKVTPLFQ